MRRTLEGALTLLRYSYAIFFVYGITHPNWWIAVGCFAGMWILFGVQTLGQLESRDASAQFLFDSVTISLPTIAMGAYYCLHHNSLLGVGLWCCLGVTIVLTYALRPIGKKNWRLRQTIAWSWIAIWQASVAALLLWMALQ